MTPLQPPLDFRDAESMSAALRRVTARNAELGRSCGDLEDGLSAVEEERDDARDQLRCAEQERDALLSANSFLDGALESMTHERDIAKRRAITANAELVSARTELDAVRTARDNLDRELAEARATIRALTRTQGAGT